MPSPRISLDGQPVHSETLVCSAGAYALALSTTIPDRGVSLHSTYLEHEGAATHVAHLLLGGGAAESDAQARPHAELPVAHSRRRCLYEHLQRLQELVEELGLGTMAIDGLEPAVEVIEA